jgi:ATP-dependent metalloprotease FtsH
MKEIVHKYKEYIPHVSLLLIICIILFAILSKVESVHITLLYLLISALTLFNIFTYLRSQRAPEHKPQTLKAQEMLPSKHKPTYSNITFNDVAGIEDVKEELNEILDFLKHPKRYKELDISLPKGVLLVGPPGVGKTMIARALAGEAGVPFFYQSGASFVELYVGAGAKKVRELFERAKTNLPAIVFIDEIDAVGKKRSSSRNEERDATLNQLLTEMDGFEDSSSLVVIAATNKIDLLDEALLRAGRFDKRVHLSLPTPIEREEILKIYLKKKKNLVDIGKLSLQTVGFSAAALATLVNEAALDALKHNQEMIRDENFFNVKDKVQLGKKRVSPYNEEEKRIHSTYQAAKALMLQLKGIEFEKISLYHDNTKLTGESIESASRIKAKIAVYLSGIAACEVIHGQRYTNSKHDLKKIDDLLGKLKTYRLSSSIVIREHDMDNLLEDLFAHTKSTVQKHTPTIMELSELLYKNELITKEQIDAVL